MQGTSFLSEVVVKDICVQVCLANYKKNGELFWNQLYIEPIFDSSGVVTRHIGIQTDVTHLYNGAKSTDVQSEPSLLCCQ